MHDFIVVGADTDGLAFKKPDQKAFTTEERQSLIAELNSFMDGLIHWEDDGVFKRQIVVRAKNYILVDESGKVKIKGSALKASTKEQALKNFIGEVIECLIKDKLDRIYSIYHRYALEIVNLTDVTDWCSKKTVTKAVLTSPRANETRVLDAIGTKPVQEGDKVYMFFKTPTELCLRENFDGTVDRETLLGKLYDTLEVFDTIIQIELYPNFALKRNADLLPKPTPKLTKAIPCPLFLNMNAVSAQSNTKYSTHLSTR